MGRVQPFGKPRIVREPVDYIGSRGFVDPLYPDETIEMRLRPLSNAEAYAAVERADNLTAIYVTGDKAEGTEPAPFQLAGERIPITRRLLVDVSSIEAMQVPIPGQDPYTAEEIIAFSENYPTAFEKMQEAVALISRRRKSDAGNASGAATETCSQSPSDSGSIPISHVEPTPS